MDPDLGIILVQVDRGTVIMADAMVDQPIRLDVALPILPHLPTLHRSPNPMIRYPLLSRWFYRPFPETALVLDDDEPDVESPDQRRPIIYPRRPSYRLPNSTIVFYPEMLDHPTSNENRLPIPSTAPAFFLASPHQYLGILSQRDCYRSSVVLSSRFDRPSRQ